MSVACGLVERPLLLHEVRVFRDHDRQDLLAQELAIDLALRQPVMHEEGEVVALLLLCLPKRRHWLLLRHDGVEVRLHLFHGEAGMDVRGQGSRIIGGGFLHHRVIIAHLRRVRRQAYLDLPRTATLLADCKASHLVLLLHRECKEHDVA